MAAGDVKGDKAIIVKLKAGTAVTKGQLVHSENDDTKWDPAASGDVGPFAVAIEDSSGDGVYFRAVIWGPVEVTYGGTNDTNVGGALMVTTQNSAAATDGPLGTVTHATATTTGIVAGVALELMDTSASTYTMFVGMGGT